MKNTNWVDIGLVLLVWIFAYRSCNTPKPEIIKLTQTDTIKLRYHDTDTITRIRLKYRHLVDSHARWVYDSTWSNLCRSYTDSLSGEKCQREVVRMLNEGQLDHELVNGYKDKWQKDSVWIEQAIEIDSIKTDRIKMLVAHLAEKPPKRKRIKDIALGAFITSLLFVVVK